MESSAKQCDNNRLEAGVLWAGGWDDYIVDPTTRRDMTPKEQEAAAKDGYSPVIAGGWLRCDFSGALRTTDEARDSTQVVKIIEHLGGGD